MPDEQPTNDIATMSGEGVVENTSRHSTTARLTAQIAALDTHETAFLRMEWRRLYRSPPAKQLSRDLLIRAIAYKLQEQAHGGLGKVIERQLRQLAKSMPEQSGKAKDLGLSLKPGVKLVREWRGDTHAVIVHEDNFEWQGQRYRSLSMIARAITGTRWSGPRFFGLKPRPRPFAAGESDHA